MVRLSAMQRTSFSEMACSIARTLDVIGEPWSPLILRDVWVGMNRFDEIQADLGISRKVLTERLNHLVEHGVLERRPYDRRPAVRVPPDREGHRARRRAHGHGRLGRPVARRRGRARRCSTAITPAGRSAESTCAAPTAASRCTLATSTCCRAPASQGDTSGSWRAMSSGPLARAAGTAQADACPCKPSRSALSFR